MEESDEAPEEGQEWRSASGEAEEGQETAKGAKEEAKGSVADLTVDVRSVGCKVGNKLKFKPLAKPANAFDLVAKRLVAVAAAAVVPLKGSEGLAIEGDQVSNHETVEEGVKSNDVGATDAPVLREGRKDSVQKTETGLSGANTGWSSGVFELMLRHSGDGTRNSIDGPGGQVCLSVKFSGVGLVCALLVIYLAILAFR
jgi:hypothetical protein